MNEVTKKDNNNKEAFLYGRSEPLEITKQKLELAKLQDGRAFEYATKEQKERHLHRTREWRLLYIIIGIIVVGTGVLFFATGTEYLSDFFKVGLGFISGLSIGSKFKFSR